MAVGAELPRTTDLIRGAAEEKTERVAELADNRSRFGSTPPLHRLQLNFLGTHTGVQKGGWFRTIIGGGTFGVSRCGSPDWRERS